MKIAPALVALFLLAGCSSPAVAQPPAAPSVTAECEIPDDGMVESLFDDEYDFVVLDAAAVRSPDHKKLWYVAVSATDGENDVVGIWAATGIEGSASVRSVDGIAREFSSWPDGKAEGLSLTDSGAKAAKACLS